MQKAKTRKLATKLFFRGSILLPRKEVVVSERSACTRSFNAANMEGVVDKIDLTSNNLVD